jgi:2-polyprenyl-6-methoxyphenol hydroxylase-like FAD-dependent oxidoreductase
MLSIVEDLINEEDRNTKKWRFWMVLSPLRLVVLSFRLFVWITTMTAGSAAFALQAGSRRRAAVVGGSLGGLAAAHALEQTGWKVDVFERSSTPMHKKGSGLGFVHTPSWESLIQKPMMRRKQRAHRSQGSFYYGDLWNFLYQALPEETTVVEFGKTITQLDGTVDAPIIDGTNYDLVVVSDGGFSMLRHHVVGRDQKPEYAGYVVWRGSVSAEKLPSRLLSNMRSMEGVYKSGIYDLIVLKMAKESGEDLWTMGTFLATPETDLSRYWNQEKDGNARHGNDDGIKSDNNNKSIPAWFLTHMTKHFGDVHGVVPLIEHMMKDGEIKAHPQYEFGANQVHRGRVVLLGDAAHMASPRTAVGAHTAILDALALRDAFRRADDDIGEALADYSQAGKAHARQLYARTREVSQDFIPRKGVDAIVSPERIYYENLVLEECDSKDFKAAR